METLGAIPLALAVKPAAPTVPATCVAWSSNAAVEFLLTTRAVVNSRWVLRTEPASQTPTFTPVPLRE